MSKFLKSLLFAPAFLLATTALSQDTVSVPAGANSEGDATAPLGGGGFAISIDGQNVAGDKRISEVVRRKDITLGKANIQVTFDGLEIKPRLGLIVVDAPERPRAGDRVRVASRLNYPAFVDRAEILVFATDPRLGARQVATVPITPNGETVITLPEGETFRLAHRVYDDKGRYDETIQRPLIAEEGPGGQTDGSFASAEIADQAERRRIPIHGGSVTVSGHDIRQGARVNVLGESLRPDAGGRLVVERILPPGEVPVAVDVRGAGEDTSVERIVAIPASEWFYVAVADVTIGRRLGNPVDANGVALDRSFNHGRVAGYAKGRTASGWTLTGRFDSGEEELSDLFDARDDNDIRSILGRLDYEELGYSEFGDDSTIEDGAPSRGKLYLRAEKGGNHAVWGDFRATIEGNHFVRNERTLYGAQGVYRSADQTSRGEARFGAELYASTPERLPQRDVFRGTGGSIYFLRRQAISVGSETVTIELRDVDTGRVLGSKRLVAGRDYQVNTLQGIITLDKPLESGGTSGLIITNPGGDSYTNLIVQYEYSPVAGDIDGMNFGGRVEGWVTDTLRFGLTGMVERTDTADQTSIAADILWQIGEESSVQLDYARTEGPGFGSTNSSNGGLVFDTVAPVGGTGEAYSLRTELAFSDLGWAIEGHASAYAERRTAGFSTLDYQTAVDEELYGFAIDVQPSDRLNWRVYYDGFEDATGKIANEGGVEVGVQVRADVKLDFGIEHVKKVTPGGAAKDTGARTDVAARLTMTPNDALTWYLFAQGTVDRSGGFERNDRVGAGIAYAFDNGFTFEGEISDGTQGTGAAVTLAYEKEDGATAYMGYRLRPGRELGGVALVGRDRGQFVAGGTKPVSDNLELWAENTYDVFGEHRAFASGYGVDWSPTDKLTWTAAFEAGEVRDSINGDVTRRALSVGVRYSEADYLEASGRVEVRRDRGLNGATSQDQDAVYIAADGVWRIDDARRLRFGFDYANVDSANGNLAEGEYIEAALGYAVRPITHDTFNMLFQYRYLKDMVGQEIDGTSGRGPVQETHVISADVEYDLNPRWSVGAKVGARFSESAPTPAGPFTNNDAWLGVLNARYHLTHKWDALVEVRRLEAKQAGLSESGGTVAIYRHVGNNLKVGLGYSTTSFSDDLTDLSGDNEGVFLNIIAKF